MYLGHFVRVVSRVSRNTGSLQLYRTWEFLLHGLDKYAEWAAGRLQTSMLIYTFLNSRGKLFFRRLVCVNLLGRLRFLFLIKHERSERS